MMHNRLKKGVLKGIIVGGGLLCSILPGAAVFAAEYIQEVVVTATRIEESGFDLPTPLEVVSQKSLQTHNPATVADPVAELPGVSMASTGYWETTPIIRGLGGSRVLVLIDGDREANLWSGRAPLVPFIDVGDVERIEVVKGPASALYGTDALGGVINIITKKSALAGNDYFSVNHSLEGRYSSVDNGWFSRYAVEGGGQGLDFGLAVSKRDSGEYRQGDGGKVANSQYEAWNVDLKGRYFLNDNNDLSASYRNGRIDDQGVPQKSLAPWSHFTKFYTDSFKVGYHAKEIGFLKDVQVRTWFDDQRRVYNGNIHSDANPMYTLKGNRIDTSVVGSSLQGRIDPAEWNRIVFGMEYFQEKTDSTEEQTAKNDGTNTTVKVTTFKPVPVSTRDHFGMYAQDEALLGRWTLLGGLRYDYFSADAEDVAFKIDKYNAAGTAITSTSTTYNRFHKTTDDAVTFNAGALYALTANIHLTSNLSTGFRAPDVFERYSTRGGSTILIGDPELKAERSWNIDGGLKMAFPRTRGALNVFYNRVNNYIDLVNSATLFGGLPTKRYINVADAELFGADGSLEHDILEKLTIFGNISHVVGRETGTHNHLNTIPPLNGKAGLRWKDEWRGKITYWLEFGSNIHARQGNPVPGENETPGYALFDVRTGMKFKYGRLKDVTLTLNVENLFDTKYRSHLNLADFTIYETGINVISALKVSF